MRRANLLTAIASVVVTLAVADGAARLAYNRPWYDAVADAPRREDIGEHRYQRNADGLRSRAITPKPDGVHRVLLLGDSFTFGWGVHDDAAIFPARLERALGPGVEIVNAAAPGTLTRQWVESWKTLADRVQPDALVIVFFLRDGTRTSSIGMFDAIRQTLDAEHRASPLYRWSFAYRLVRDRMDRRMLSNRYRAAFHDAYFGTDEDRAEWLDAQRNLAAIVTAARARGVRIGLVVFPVLIDLDPAIYPFADVCDAVSAYAILQGVPTMSLLPAFLGKQDRALWVSDVDQHPNAEAHAIAADALVPFVRALL